MAFFLREARWLALLLLTGALPVAAEPKEPVRFLLPPLASPERIYARFQPLADHLSEALDRPVKPHVAQDLETLLRLTREDRPQIAYLCPLIYTRLADPGGLVPLARLQRQGKSTLRTAVVVRSDSPYEALSELEGARFAYGSPVCAASRLVPRAMLSRAGLDPQHDFFEDRTLGSNENALYAVAADMFDATAVNESSARPFLEKGVLRALAYSRPIPQYLIAATPEMAESQRQRITRILTTLDPSKDKRVLAAIGTGVDGFTATDDAPYDVIRSLIRRHLDPTNGGTSGPLLRDGETGAP